MLVDGTCRLRAVGNLHALFDEIDDREMYAKPPEHDHQDCEVPRSCQTILYYMADRCPLARRMRVVVAQLPGKAFEMVPGRSNYTPNLDASISSISGLKKNKRKFAYIY
ncbi:hypothetical protein GGR53DRAFT_251851 [Hypoxylon sp. FL1150]|nr:hypothetical protein GGR53DRAFT_251851 [Hypoxylon sp. FL1150]